MKKIFALILAILLVMSLAACGDDDSDPTTTTTEPIGTTADIVTDNNVTQNTTAANNENVGLTYILTTEYGQTMPTVVTTAFNLANEIAAQTTAPTELNLNFTVPTMNAPPVVTEKSTTKPTTTNSETEKEKTEPEATTKADSEKTRKYLDMVEHSVASDGNILLVFSLDDWEGGVKTRTLSNEIPISYSGTSKKVNALVKQSGDNIFVTLYTGSLNIPEDEVVNFRIPAGTISSKKNTQTNASYEAGIRMETAVDEGVVDE